MRLSFPYKSVFPLCLAMSMGGGGLNPNSSNNSNNRHQSMLGSRADGQTSLLHMLGSCGPSTLIHHPAQPTSSSSSPYPHSPSYPNLGMSSNSSNHQPQHMSANNRTPSASSYSAKVVAFQQSADRQPQLAPSSGANFGLTSANSSQSSRPSSVEDPVAATAASIDDDDDSFFNFDSLTSHQPYLPYPPQGPLHPSELQLAGKNSLLKPFQPNHTHFPFLPTCSLWYGHFLLSPTTLTVGDNIFALLESRGIYGINVGTTAICF